MNHKARYYIFETTNATATVESYDKNRKVYMDWTGGNNVANNDVTASTRLPYQAANGTTGQ